MRIKKGFKLKLVSGRQTVVADRRIIKNFNSVIILNETAVFIWDLMYEQDVIKEKIPELLADAFNMPIILATNNANVFIKTMRENGIIED